MGLSPWVRTHLISIKWLAIVLVEVSFKHVLYFEVQYFTKLSSRALSASKLERVCSALARDTALERGENLSARAQRALSASAGDPTFFVNDKSHQEKSQPQTKKIFFR